MSWVGLTRELHKIPANVIESRKMKKTFNEKVDGSEIDTHSQEKFKECLTQLRNGFNDLRKRRKEYKTAKLSKKSESADSRNPSGMVMG